MKRFNLLFSFIISVAIVNAQQNEFITVPDNLVAEGIPSLASSIVNEVQPYTEARSASFQDWHPVEKKMIISTRFANSNQFHTVDHPLGARKQLTFFGESPSGANYNPVNSNYFLYMKDVGGNEFANIFRYDVATGKSVQLTNDERAQNGGIRWHANGTQVVYSSTRRNKADRDIYILDPMNPGSDKLLVEMKGGGWGVSDWSKDGTRLLINKYSSVNESSVWIYNMQSQKLELFYPKTNVRSVNAGLQFSKDGNYVYILSSGGGEFNRPIKVEIATGKETVLVGDINWEIEQYSLNNDETKAAFIVNEGGIKKIYIQQMQSLKYAPVEGLPVGVGSSPSWHNDGKSIAFNFTTSNSSADVFEWNDESGKLIRWTESEMGGMNLSDVPAPKLIKWKSFDGKEISGFLYEAPARFSGKRPVIINIHGGPEGQSLPVFLGRLNYYINELGISVIFPNVRGSVGYGKSFTDLDNGIKREESVKDIGSLLSWIEKWPTLDASRVMVTGGSYGGYMTLAVAFHYNDKIRCAIDIVGISHFTTFLKNTESYRRDLRRVEYGDERDPKIAAFFEKIAPLNNAHKIKKPMFIIQGKNDPRVPYTEARQMVEKIKNNKGEVWYLEASDEGHGFRKKHNQDFQFYATIEFIKRFLLN